MCLAIASLPFRGDTCLLLRRRLLLLLLLLQLLLLVLLIYVYACNTLDIFIRTCTRDVQAAQPWYTDVREKLLSNPDWFLKFDPSKKVEYWQCRIRVLAV